jgi:hypothetical protein
MATPSRGDSDAHLLLAQIDVSPISLAGSNFTGISPRGQYGVGLRIVDPSRLRCLKPT